MRVLPLAIAALALALSSGTAAADCGAHQAKSSSEVASTTKPLIDRLVALLPAGSKIEQHVAQPRAAK